MDSLGDDIIMREQVSLLTQSKFFSPVFNAAIFDGPIRIYFAQNQESSALKLYFACMKRLRADIELEANIFILIYPSAENFSLVFGDENLDEIQLDQLDEDFVVGLNGPIDEEDFESFFKRFDTLVRVMPSRPAAPALDA